MAQSLATVWARVLMGFTWKTGYESWPSLRPRSERMMEMKWMQLEPRRGIEELSVSSCERWVSQIHEIQGQCINLTLTSTWLMLPTTFLWLSRTGRLVIPSSCMSISASLNGRSPLIETTTFAPSLSSRKE